MSNLAHIHPMFVHFPIALLMVGFLADTAFLFFKKEKCLSKTGLYLLIIGTLAALAAYFSGSFLTTHPTSGSIYPIFENHETFALFTLIAAVLTLTVRLYVVISKKEETKLKWLVYLLYALTACFVSITGFLGGSMVYDFMLSI
jgi:uncharacterized membrane protein